MNEGIHLDLDTWIVPGLSLIGHQRNKTNRNRSEDSDKNTDTDGPGLFSIFLPFFLLK